MAESSHKTGNIICNRMRRISGMVFAVKHKFFCSSIYFPYHQNSTVSGKRVFFLVNDPLGRGETRWNCFQSKHTVLYPEQKIYMSE